MVYVLYCGCLLSNSRLPLTVCKTKLLCFHSFPFLLFPAVFHTSFHPSFPSTAIPSLDALIVCSARDLSSFVRGVSSFFFMNSGVSGVHKNGSEFAFSSSSVGRANE